MEILNVFYAVGVTYYEDKHFRNKKCAILLLFFMLLFKWLIMDRCVLLTTITAIICLILNQLSAFPERKWF